MRHVKRPRKYEKDHKNSARIAGVPNQTTTTPEKEFSYRWTNLLGMWACCEFFYAYLTHYKTGETHADSPQHELCSESGWYLNMHCRGMATHFCGIYKRKIKIATCSNYSAHAEIPKKQTLRYLLDSAREFCYTICALCVADLPDRFTVRCGHDVITTCPYVATHRS